MAKMQVVTYSYTCDVCGDTIPAADVDAATRNVSWEGTDYSIDVCSTHGSLLGDLLTELKGFVDAGNRSSGRRGRRPGSVSAPATAAKAPRGRRAAGSTASAGTAPKRGDLGTVRAWARENGMTINERGRIPAALLAAYDAAHGPSATAPALAEAEAAPAPAAASRKRTPRKKAAAAQ